MQSNLYTETFNIRDVDPVKLKERAETEHAAIVQNWNVINKDNRSSELIKMNCYQGHVAEVYFLDNHNFTDNLAKYQDLLNSIEIPIEFKTTTNPDYRAGIEKTFISTHGNQRRYGLNERRYELGYNIPDKIYGFHVNPKTGDYKLVVTATANDLLRKYVLDDEIVL